MTYISIILFWTIYLFLNKWISFLYILPGTIMHELSHFIIGLVFLGNPNSFSLIPKKTEGGFILGSVTFSNIRFFNAIPIALAPLLLLYIAFLLLRFSNNSPIIEQFIFGFLIFNLIFSSVPSSTDLKVLLSKPIGILFYLVIIVFFMGGNNDFKDFFNLLFNKSVWNGW